jgi:hypothetical protein
MTEQRVEGVQLVRQAIFDHFSSHFKACSDERPRVEDLQFSTLTLAEGGNLVRPFSVEKFIQRFGTMIVLRA